MILLPAIDLIGGKVVRLTRGDYARATVYGDDPLAVALSFRDAGAEHLHVVDLEGARDGGRPNEAVIRRLIAESGLSVEVGGGVRDHGAAEAYLSAGAERVILGTAAAENRDLVRELCAEYGDRIAVGVDARDGVIATRGWTETSGEDLFSFCRRMESLGVRTLICTDISKDGVLSGANVELYRRLTGELSAKIIASGGVSSLGDVRALMSAGVFGAILGRALYTGALSLGEAIKTVKEQMSGS